MVEGVQKLCNGFLIKIPVQMELAYKHLMKTDLT